MMRSALRGAILGVAERDEVERFVRHARLSRALVRRFVAGETVSDALSASERLATEGLTTTLDLLGENVLSASEAQHAVESYAGTLRAMAAHGLEPNISVKLTMLGLDIGDDVAFESMVTLLETATDIGGFVRIDMESSDYTERTLRIAEALHLQFPARVGTVIQASLLRSERDVEHLIDLHMRVRLAKGAYAEPANIALQRPREIDAAYVKLMERLLVDGRYPAIATHDDALIRATRGFALRMGIDPARWEFQMLYGVRRDVQQALVAEGYHLRIYVPFGTDWYPYFARRIAERPANALFVLRQLVSR